MAFDWILRRYQEIRDLELVEKYCGELEGSGDEKRERIHADQKRLGDIVTCLQETRKEALEAVP